MIGPPSGSDIMMTDSPTAILSLQGRLFPQSNAETLFPPRKDADAEEGNTIQPLVFIYNERLCHQGLSEPFQW